jgi:hypothetical protein
VSKARGRAGSAAVGPADAASWSELTERLYEDSWAESLGRFRSRYVFRGEPLRENGLRSSLQRLGSPAKEVEHHLLRNFRKFARPGAALGPSVWNWMALAQHHGLPTRLLDWTFSPYVALHFATASPEAARSDGVVWCVDFNASRRWLPARLRGALRKERADLFTTEMLAQAAPSLEDLARLGRSPFVVFFDPPSLDERLTNQFSVFSACSDPREDMEDWLGRRPGLAKAIAVPAALKDEVRDKLDQANVTERVLFPGLDGLARWLARYYAPRGGASPGEPERRPGPAGARREWPAGSSPRRRAGRSGSRPRRRPRPPA